MLRSSLNAPSSLVTLLRAWAMVCVSIDLHFQQNIQLFLFRHSACDVHVLRLISMASEEAAQIICIPLSVHHAADIYPDYILRCSSKDGPGHVYRQSELPRWTVAIFSRYSRASHQCYVLRYTLCHNIPYRPPCGTLPLTIDVHARTLNSLHSYGGAGLYGRFLGRHKHIWLLSFRRPCCLRRLVSSVRPRSL